MKALVVFVLAMGLTACIVLQHDMSDLNPRAPDPPEEKIAGSYVVALVGNLDQPVKSAMINKAYNPYFAARLNRPSSETTIAVGEPLRKTMIGAFRDAMSNPQFVSSEAEARSAVGSGRGAIIIAFMSGNSQASKQEGQGLMNVTSSAVITLLGNATVIRPDGKEETVPFSAVGNHSNTTRGFDQDLPATRTAAESAVTIFARKAVATAQYALARLGS